MSSRARPVSDPHLTDELRQRLAAYYERYYRQDLGLRDWQERVRLRQDEEQNFAEPMLRRIDRWLNVDFAGMRVLVVGSGTGAELLALARRGAEVWGVEPNADAVAIARLKCGLEGVPEDRVAEGVAEALPFDDVAFDFVYCYTVLEHVQDVERSIDEMLRVTRPGGTVFIQTPDYRYPYEGHYKTWFVPFAPRWVQALVLRSRGRPTAFLRTINFLTAPALDRMLWSKNADVLRAYEPQFLGNGGGIRSRYARLLAVPPQQFIFLRKRP